MEINSNPVNTQPTSSQINAGVAARPQEQQQEVKAQRVADVQKPEDTLNQRSPEETRLQLVKEAAAQRVNPYIVSDSRFTIYKQFAGENYVYVTRITSLKDGAVTIIPEQELTQNFGAGRILQTSA